MVTPATHEMARTVQSADETTIAYEHAGAGPALILVGGAFSTRQSGYALRDLLVSSFDVYVYDRRGRGGSTDTVPYAVERELEDLAALIEAAGGTVDVTLEILANQSPRLSVADLGDPIAADDLAHVFQRFYRGRRTPQQPGSGLGLSLVKAIADLHDIEVFFETRDQVVGKRAVLQFTGTCL